MKYKQGFFGAVVLTVCVLLPLHATAVVPGQVDTFESGTTEGWGVGSPSPVPPQIMNDGGPQGAGDHYMLLTSLGGGGAGSKLVVFNTTQWAGNYKAAGITVITMNLNNVGFNDLAMRLSFASNSSLAVTTDAVMVPAGSGWISATFAIDAAHLTVISGTADDALQATTQVRLFHNTLPNTAVPIEAQLGVDNIRAVAPVTVSVSGRVDLGVTNLTTISPGAPLGNVTIDYRLPGSTMSVATQTAPLTADPSAHNFAKFTVPGLPSGTYDLRIKTAKNLAVVVQNIALDGMVTLPDVVLPGGDANNDNRVDFGDFGTLVNAYSTVYDPNDPGNGYDPAGDFTFDGRVDGGDFGILVNSYGQTGDL